MPYTLTALLVFDDLGQAQDAYNQLSARATNTTIVGMGTADEHTSYCRLDDDTSLLSMFHVDTFGIVRQGDYVTPDPYPVWIAPTGAHDSYPATDAAGNVTRVMHNGQAWENTHGNGNSWAPGSVGTGALWQTVLI